MKTTSLLFAALLLLVTARSSFAKMGFQTEPCEVHSVVTSDLKVVFVVSGGCEMLLSKVSDSSGNAQKVSSVLHACVIILHRAHEQYPTEESWKKACEEFKAFSGKRASFTTVFPRLYLGGKRVAADFHLSAFCGGI
jgi:hypothetical protein